MKEPYPGFNKGRMTIQEAKMINKEKGKHFFDKDTMKFFDSRIETDALRFGQLIDDKYFVTSEKDGDQPRKFTVREFNPLTGGVSTVGDFQEFSTREVARKFAWCLADGHDAEVCRQKVGLKK